MLESPRRLLDCMFYRDDEVARLEGGKGCLLILQVGVVFASASIRCVRSCFVFIVKTPAAAAKKKNLPKNKRCRCFLSDCRKIIAKSSFRSCPLAGLLGDDVRLAQACARARDAPRAPEPWLQAQSIVARVRGGAGCWHSCPYSQLHETSDRALLAPDLAL